MLKIKSVHIDRVREVDNLSFILSRGRIVEVCDKCNKEKESVIVGGVIYTEGVDEG